MFVLLGCASANNSPKIISFTDTTVVIDYTDSKNLAEATKKAELYCGAIEKSAKYVTEKELTSFSDDRKLAVFNCVSSNN